MNKIMHNFDIKKDLYNKSLLLYFIGSIAVSAILAFFTPLNHTQGHADYIIATLLYWLFLITSIFTYYAHARKSDALIFIATACFLAITVLNIVCILFSSPFYSIVSIDNANSIRLLMFLLWAVEILIYATVLISIHLNSKSLNTKRNIFITLIIIFGIFYLVGSQAKNYDRVTTVDINILRATENTYKEKQFVSLSAANSTNFNSNYINYSKFYSSAPHTLYSIITGSLADNNNVGFILQQMGASLNYYKDIGKSDADKPFINKLDNWNDIKNINLFDVTTYPSNITPNVATRISNSFFLRQWLYTIAIRVISIFTFGYFVSNLNSIFKK